MKSDSRQAPRFVEIGRVDAPEICLFSGVLVDISESGCRVRFPAILEIDTDCDYEIKITCARKEFTSPFILIANVSWLNNLENSCEVGFRIIRSPSTREFHSFIKSLEEENRLLEEEKALMQGFGQ